MIYNIKTKNLTYLKSKDLQTRNYQSFQAVGSCFDRHFAPELVLSEKHGTVKCGYGKTDERRKNDRKRIDKKPNTRNNFII